jgi:hypothetical protein
MRALQLRLASEKVRRTLPGVPRTWHFEGDRFADTFNARQAIRSDDDRIGYFKVLRAETPDDPWLEQWANEQIVSELARLLKLPAIETHAGFVEEEPGAITLFSHGHKLSEFEALRFHLPPLVEAALNRDQLGLVVAFDIWLLNVDRHTGNLFVTVEDGRTLLNLIDHGHTLLLPREQKKASPAPDDWEEFVVSGALEEPDVTNQTLGNYLRPFVKAEEIRAGARTIANLGDDEIASVVDVVPDGFLCGPPPAAMTRLLTHRKEKLSECLEGVL